MTDDNVTDINNKKQPNKVVAHLKKHQKKYIIGSSVFGVTAASLIIRRQIVSPTATFTVGQAGPQLVARVKDVAKYNNVVDLAIRTGPRIVLETGEKVIAGVMAPAKDMKVYNKLASTLWTGGIQPGVATQEYLIPHVSAETAVKVREVFEQLAQGGTGHMEKVVLKSI